MHFAQYDAPMSTSKPRITITLEESTAERLRRVSELTGNSQSKLVSEVLQQADAVFDRLIVVLEAAEQAKKKLSRASVQGLAAAQRRVEAQLGLAMEDFNEATEPFLALGGQKRVREGSPRGEGPARADGESVLKKGKRFRGGKVPTPLSNRGVRSSPDVVKKPAKRASNA